MNNLYETIMHLCEDKGIKPGRMCVDIKISKGNISDLKMGRIKSLSAESLSKIANYFGVTVDYLLGAGQKENAPADRGEDVSDDDIKFALFGGDGEITDEMYNEVKNFAQYVKQRERSKGE